jgi:hypothetical protein
MNNALHYPNGLKAVALGSAAPYLTVQVGEEEANTVSVTFDEAKWAAAGAAADGELSACVILARL